MGKKRSLVGNRIVAAAAVFGLLGLGGTGTGCSGSRYHDPVADQEVAGPALTPNFQGPAIPNSEIANGTAELRQLSNGATVRIHRLKSQLWLEVEGILTPRAFETLEARTGLQNRDRAAQFRNQEFQKVLTQLAEAGAQPLEASTELGYFTALVPYEAEGLSRFARCDFPYQVVLNPAVIDRDSLKEAKENRLALDSGTTAFSGLQMMGIPEFLHTVEAEIGTGEKVDGSSSRIGITDTGITYNHPTFRSRRNPEQIRIDLLRDYTKEGRVYFHPLAAFKAEPGSSPKTLRISAEIIRSRPVPALPPGDLFERIDSLEIGVSPELKARLTAPAARVRLGFLQENLFQSEGDEADINANGKVDDAIPMLLVLGESPEQDELFVDFSAQGDFSQSAPLRDFSSSGLTAPVFAERIGFDLRIDHLPDAQGRLTVRVHSASIVGYDPGNHGSHVAGIAAGLKTIANDDDETLARGAAPEAMIQMARVCSNTQGCNAMNALVELVSRGHSDVINMSLGGLSPFNDGFGVQETLINRLTSAKNTLFMISAGNSGPGRQTVGSPSTARLSLSIGAAANSAMLQRQYLVPGVGSPTFEDFMLFFSSRGPTAAGGFKPNLAAPGTELSSIQLNTAPGAHGGLDVYWGTSMAAPAATGAYALFLDAIRKFNRAHPEQALISDVSTLRRVLIESARPFDVNRFDPQTGERTEGQYTWIDQGTGMISLPRAWAALRALSAEPIDSSVRAPLDYEVYVVDPAPPSGQTYDGTRPAQNGATFGTGLYLSSSDTESLRLVHLGRRLREGAVAADELGARTRELLTTADTFEFKTVFYGSAEPWLKVGGLNSLDCDQGIPTDFRLIGRGADFVKDADGKATLVPAVGGALAVCIDRNRIETSLPPGDHGALIQAYRKLPGHNRASSVATFTIPVFLNVPHKTLGDATGYRITGTVKSFGLSRHSVQIPAGTTLVRVSLEVPAMKTNSRGRVAAGEHCSGVELMALAGGNTVKLARSRAEGRVANCDGEGRPSARRTKVEFTVNSPRSGTWDLSVFGQNKFVRSDFTLSVDYQIAQASITKIQGDVSALNGRFDWEVRSTSIGMLPDRKESAFEISGLETSHLVPLAQGETHFLPNAEGGLFHVFDAAAFRSVKFRTTGPDGNPTRNDIDLALISCALEADDTNHASCREEGRSAGESDQEEIAVQLQGGRKYALRIEGYAISDSYYRTLVLLERTARAVETGDLRFERTPTGLQIEYGFSEAARLASRLLQSEEFRAGHATLRGRIRLLSDSKTPLLALPVEIQN